MEEEEKKKKKKKKEKAANQAPGCRLSKQRALQRCRCAGSRGPSTSRMRGVRGSLPPGARPRLSYRRAGERVAGDAQAAMPGGGGGRRGGEEGSHWDSLKWAEGRGGCYTVARGKAERLQIAAPRLGAHPIAAGRPGGSRSAGRGFPAPRSPRAARAIPAVPASASGCPQLLCPSPPVQQRGERQHAEVRSEPSVG